MYLFKTDKYLGLLCEEGQREKWYSRMGGGLDYNDAWVKG